MLGECAGLISSIFATLAVLFSLLGSFWCKSFKFTPVQPEQVVGFGYPDIHMSPWLQQTTSVNYGSLNGENYVWVNKFCVNFWVDPELDTYWKVVQAFSIIAIVFGGLGTCALYGSCCFPTYFKTCLWRSLALKFIVLVTISQGLTLLIFKSSACTDNNIMQALEAEVGRNSTIYNTTCEWDVGSNLNITAVVFWFTTGVLMILIGPPEPNPLAFDNPPSDQQWDQPSEPAAEPKPAAAEKEKDEKIDDQDDSAKKEKEEEADTPAATE